MVTLITMIIDEETKGKELYKFMSENMNFDQVMDLYILLKNDIKSSNLIGTQCCYEEEQEKERAGEQKKFNINIKTNVIDIHEFIIKNMSFIEVLIIYSLINNKIKNLAADWYSSITDEGKNI